MKQILIQRDSSGKVTFNAVSIDVTETVFFTNMDKQAAHWPTLASNQVGPYQSPNSSQCPVPAPMDNTKNPPVAKTPPYTVTYKCQIAGHNETGTINVVPVLTAVPAATTTTPALTLAVATKGQPITAQQVVIGGVLPYTISGQLFQIVDSNNKVIQSGSGIGPGLTLTPKPSGIWVSGTPTVAGTYQFTFEVNDAAGHNLQQAQYSMKVVQPGLA